MCALVVVGSMPFFIVVDDNSVFYSDFERGLYVSICLAPSKLEFRICLFPRTETHVSSALGNVAHQTSLN